MRVVLVLLLGLLCGGCAPTVRVTVLQPAPVNLGQARRLSVVQAEGHPDARVRVLEELLKQIRADGFFSAQDQSAEGMNVRVLGDRVEVTGGRSPSQTPDEVRLRIDVLDWDARPGLRPVTRSEKQEEKDAGAQEGPKPGAREAQRWAPVLAAKVVLGVTAFNAQGRALLAGRAYEGRAEAPEGSAAEPTLRQASKEAVGRLLRDITPRYVVRTLRLDDEDEQQRPIIKLAEGGNVVVAAEELRRYVQTNPLRGSAHYNLAVLLDAQGRYTEALDEYAAALRLSTKAYYVAAKAGCARRLADQQALSR